MQRATQILMTAISALHFAILLSYALKIVSVSMEGCKLRLAKVAEVAANK